MSVESFSVLLARHPPVQKREGYCYGITDLPLQSPQEKTMEDTLAKWLTLCQAKGFKKVYTSPLQRCFLPARLLANRLGLPLWVDHHVRELNFGEWEGQAWNKISSVLLQQWVNSPWEFTPPGGESASMLLTRLKKFVTHLQEQSQNCIIITHGGPLRMLPALLAARKPDCLADPLAMGEARLYTVRI
ncbi:Histidine phosphatase superfamily [Entomobacter blattae]|uniref:Histidine phosphatase superfamily n=2 Tax=Entomobacter blattae TaxID=2762277 RepID=A0A7H1NQ15_9PROT|nr:Histidine phosphatase superfamily [Entomobacter blattae]